MKIAITGATGFIGKATARLLKDHGFDTRLIIRNNKKNQFYDQEIFNIDNINKKTIWKDSLNNIHTVIHCAGFAHDNDNIEHSKNFYDEINFEGTLNLAQESIKHRVKRFIFLSTAKVNGEKNLLNRPFLVDDIENPIGDYAISKYKAEKALLEFSKKSDLEVVIIRLPLVYGENVKGNFYKLLKLIKKNIPIPFGKMKNKRSYIYIENLIQFIICVIKKVKISSGVYFVSDDHDLSTSELISLLINFLGSSSKLYNFPIFYLKLFSKALQKENQFNKLNNSMQVDISHTKKTFNWKPLIPITTGLKKTVEYFKNNSDKININYIQK